MAWVMPLSKREGEEGVGAVLFRLHVAHMLLVWGALYGAKNHMEKACGATFVPFYSAKMEIMSKKGTKVAQPQCEMQILIEKGNTVVQPPCQYFQVWRDTGFHRKRISCGTTYF